LIVTEFDIPAYFVQEFKTKKNKKWLTGMNWYRNSHFAIQNTVKAHYAELIKEKITDIELSEPLLSYEVTYTYNYKNVNSDMPNVTALASKFCNDVFQEVGLVTNDNVQHLCAEHHYTGTRNTKDPHVHVVLQTFRGIL
jgi:hypothetical protein